jgi:glycerophosphoryl diester phosphodiesterase
MKIDPWFHLIKAAPWEAPFQLPTFQSHRGYHANGAQENTLAAFRAARKLGAQMCECDVRLDKNQIPVVFHDNDLKRISGKETQVSEMTLAELKQLANVCTLEELLTDSEVPEIINIELKAGEIDDPLPLAVARVIQSTKAEHRIVLSSFNPFALWKAQRLLPEVPRALLVTNVPHKDNRWWIKRMVLAPFLKIHMLNLDEAMITENVADFWKKQGVPLAAWTVDDRKRGRELLGMGVSSIISDLKPSEI